MRCLSLFALAGALLGASAAAVAQTYPLPSAPPGGGAGNGSNAPVAHRHSAAPMRQALEGVGLSADQKSKVRQEISQFRAARQSGTPMTRKQLMSNIDSHLTPDQQTQFHSLLAKYRLAAKRSASGNPQPPQEQPAQAQPGQKQPQPQATS